MAERKTCIDCRWFQPDPSAVVDPFAIVSVIHEAQRPPGTSQDSHPSAYGKCTAEYIDQEGKFQWYFNGNFDDFACNATDDQGNWLFSPKEQ